MPWTNSNASWPASAEAINSSADSVLSQVETAMSEAVGRLTETEGKVSYTRHDLSGDAEALLSLRADLNNLLVSAKTVTVTPAVFGLDENKNDGYLSAQAAIAALAAKLSDNADKHLPANQAHALVLLLSAASPSQLLSQLTPICNLLAVPSLLAYQRQLQKKGSLAAEKMQQTKAAIAPRWTQAHSLNYQPLRTASGLLGAQIAQLESLSNDSKTPLQKLTALAEKRTVMLEQLQSDLTALQSVSGSIWRFAFSGPANQLAVELQNAEPPVNKPVSVAIVISSAQPLIFLQELLP